LATDAPAATAKLHDARHLLVVVTNQPDVAHGITTRERVHAIKQLVLDRLTLDAVYFCFHNSDSCECRKPKAGVLHAAARDLNLDPAVSWLIGDLGSTDVEASQSAAFQSVLLERSYNWRNGGGVLPTLNLTADATTTTWRRPQGSSLLTCLSPMDEQLGAMNTIDLSVVVPPVLQGRCQRSRIPAAQRDRGPGPADRILMAILARPFLLVGAKPQA
jgi:histidinol-phosphate phosphatase family protein